MLTPTQDHLDPDVIQNRLNQLYESWRLELREQKAWFEGAVPPHLLAVTADYCRAPVRILFYGQETESWSPEEGQSFDCFVGGDCLLEQLMEKYREFNFAAGTPRFNSPFWRAFRNFQKLDGSGVLWANLCKTAFETTQGYSFLRASAERRAIFVAQQTNLMREEVDILQPHAIVFTTGPYYDHILKEVFEVERFDEVVPELTSRQLGRVVSPFLPPLSLRTYHPGFINRDLQVRQRWLEEARMQIAQRLPAATAASTSVGD